MDTNLTITELEKLSLDLKNQAEGIKANEISLLNRADGIDLAISQLQGILKVQLSSLTSDQLKTFPEVILLISQVEIAEIKISDLETQVNNLTLQLSNVDAQLETIVKIIQESISLDDLKARYPIIVLPIDVIQ